MCIAGTKAASRNKASNLAKHADDSLEDLAAAEPDQADAEQPSQESDWALEADVNRNRTAVKASSPAAGRKPAKSRASRIAAAVKGALARSAEKEALPPGAWQLRPPFELSEQLCLQDASVGMGLCAPPVSGSFFLRGCVLHGGGGAGEDAAGQRAPPQQGSHDRAAPPAAQAVGAQQLTEMDRPASGGWRTRNGNGRAAAAGKAGPGQPGVAGTSMDGQQKSAGGDPPAADAAQFVRESLQPAAGDDLLRANTSDEDDEEEDGAGDEGKSTKLPDGLGAKTAAEDDIPEKEAAGPTKRCAELCWPRRHVMVVELTSLACAQRCTCCCVQVKEGFPREAQSSSCEEATTEAKVSFQRCLVMHV